eukprot:16228-Heterococcus_DN1.PRE.1
MQAAVCKGGALVPPIDSGIRIQCGVAPAGSRPAAATNELHQWFGDTGAQIRHCYEPAALELAIHKPVLSNTYALTATYGGIDSKQFDMIYAVYHVGGNTGDENASWQQSEVKGECLARLSKNSFPQEVTAVAAACTRFFEDAYCLASRLADLESGKLSSLSSALQSYERARKPVVSSLLAKSVFLGAVETLDGSLGAA